jgi:hypothetical protein
MSFKKFLFVVSVAISLAGCSKSPTAPSTFTQTVPGTVSIFGTNLHPLTIGQNGTLTLTLTWASPAVDLDLYLAPSSCTSLYPKTSCGILTSSEAIGTTSEFVSRVVTSGQTFSVFVDNLSTTTAQAYSIAVKVE